MVRWEVVVVEAVVGLADLYLTGSRGSVGLAKGGCTHEEVQGEEVVCGVHSIPHHNYHYMRRVRHQHLPITVVPRYRRPKYRVPSYRRPKYPVP